MTFRVSVVVSAALVVTAASAADLPARKGPPLVDALPAYSWTGFYVGVHRGQGGNSTTGVWDGAGAAFPPTTLDRSGSVFGLQGGYNLQSGAFVGGVELDGSFTAFSRRALDSEIDLARSRQRYLASLRARVGVAMDRWLVYATGGAAITDWRHTYENGTAFARSARVGYVVGGGLEYALGGAWTGRIEGLYYHFGRTVGTSVFPDGDPGDRTRFGGVTVVRAGLNYRLGEEPFRLPIGGAGPVPDYSGFYLGLHGGHAAQSTSHVFNGAGSAFLVTGLDRNGIVGGVQAGYNWQFDRWVAGLEADATWIGFRKSVTDSEGDTHASRLGYLASARGRLGYVWGRTLWFATAGVALNDWRHTYENGAAPVVRPSRAGYVVGLGTEVALGRAWSLRGESLYYGFNKTIDTFALGVPDADAGDRTRFNNVAVFRAALNYRFGGGAPPVFAKN